MSTEIEKALLDERARVWDKARDIVESCARTNRDMSPDEQQQYDRLTTELDDLGEQIRDTRARDERERIAAPLRERVFRDLRDGSSDSPFERSESFRDFAQGRTNAVEFRLGDDFSRRDLSTGMSNATVQTSLMREIYSWLASQGAVLDLARRFETPDGAPLVLPLMNTPGTAAIVGEGTAIAENDPTLAKLTLGAYKYAQLLQVSSEYLADSAVPMHAWVTEQTVTAVGSAVAGAICRGSGSNQPLGLLGSAALGTAVVSQTGGTGVPSYGNVIDLAFGVRPGYRKNGSFICADSWLAACRKIVDSNGRPIFEPATTPGAYDMLVGWPVFVDEFVGAVGTAAGTPAAFGDWQKCFAVRLAGGIRVERSDDFAFSTDTATYRAVVRVDSGFVDTRAAKIMKSPTS